MNAVTSCAFSQNDMYLATTSWDKTVNLYNLSSGSFRSVGPMVLQYHEGCVNNCSFSQDGKFTTDTKTSKG